MFEPPRDAGFETTRSDLHGIIECNPALAFSCGDGDLRASQSDGAFYKVDHGSLDTLVDLFATEWSMPVKLL